MTTLYLPDVCETYAAVYNMLAELDADLLGVNRLRAKCIDLDTSDTVAWTGGWLCKPLCSSQLSIEGRRKRARVDLQKQR